MAKVILKDIKKIYPNTEKKKKVKKGEEPEKKNHLQITDEGVVAVQQFSLEIADREFIVLVGPSGCGKSTTLRMIAGLEDITSGELWIGDKLIPPRPCRWPAGQQAHRRPAPDEGALRSVRHWRCSLCHRAAE